LSVVITSANIHYIIVAIDTVDNIVVKIPPFIIQTKAYHSKEIEQEIMKRRYIPHIRHRRGGGGGE